MACPHFEIAGDKTVDIDMKEYFRGYTNNPTFSIAATDGVSVKDNGNGKYTFSKAANAAVPLVSVNVTATDADNVGSYTRTFNFYISDVVSTGVNGIVNNVKPNRYEIYNLAGMKVAEGKLPKSQLRGTYIVKGMRGAQTVKTYKVVLN